MKCFSKQYDPYMEFLVLHLPLSQPQPMVDVKVNVEEDVGPLLGSTARCKYTELDMVAFALILK